MIGRKPKEITYKVNENGCHVCTSHAPSKTGHIPIRVNKKKEYLHRLIYAENVKLITKGNIVRHICDNPACINPDHLVEGTQSDNMRDRSDRNRTVKGITHGMSKLNEQQVTDIFTNTIDTIEELSQKYNVDCSNIRNIRAGRTWKHITQQSI